MKVKEIGSRWWLTLRLEKLIFRRKVEKIFWAGAEVVSDPRIPDGQISYLFEDTSQAIPQEVKNCPHDDWTVNESDRLGWGSCVKCGGCMMIDVLWMNWKVRID